MNKKGAIAIVAVIAILVAGFIYVDNGGKIDFLGNYAFDVELEDPSFHLVNVNNTTLIEDGVSNYTYNSTVMSITIPQDWNGSGDAYLYDIVNMLNTSVTIKIGNNFTNGAIFTYLLMKNGQTYSTYGTVHNATFEVLLRNNVTGNYSTEMVVAHDIISDGNFHYEKSNYTVVDWGILGDGLPIINSTISIHIPAKYYVYIGIGNTNWVYRFMPPSYGVSDTVLHKQNENRYYKGEISI